MIYKKNLFLSIIALFIYFSGLYELYFYQVKIQHENLQNTNIFFNKMSIVKYTLIFL